MGGSEFCLEEKWKLPKKGTCRSSQGGSSSLFRSASSSCRPTSTSTSSSSARRCSFTRRCARLVKEQRARFYIMRRCVTMLVCWRDYGDS